MSDKAQKIQGIPRYFDLETAKGIIPGTAGLNKFGRNVDVAGATHEIIWDGHATALTFPTVAAQLTITSSGDDDAAGTAAQSITIQGVDANWDLLSETIDLDATSDATSVGSYLRVFRAFVASVGAATEWNDNDIDILSGANLLARISATMGQTLMAVYSVPVNKSLYITDYYFSLLRSTGATAVAAEVDMHTRDSVTGVTLLKHTLGGLNTGGTPFPFEFTPPFKVSEKTDVWMDASSSAAADISAGFNGYLIDD